MIRSRASSFAFVLVAFSLGFSLACARVTRPTPDPNSTPHLGDAWFPHRAASLKITPEEARKRDAALPEDAVPESAWDATSQQEAVALWQTQCASCHGLTGKGEGAPPMNPAPRNFGTMGLRMGFTFGGDKMRAGLYRKIGEGGTKKVPPTAMPEFASKLSREQRWALVYYIESL